MHIVQNVRDVDNRVILADNCMLKVHRKNGENSQHDKNKLVLLPLLLTVITFYHIYLMLHIFFKQLFVCLLLINYLPVQI